MSDRRKVRPVEGRTVINELTGKPVEKAGEEVPNSRFYLRRIADGDLADFDEPADKEHGVESNNPDDAAAEHREVLRS